MNASLCPFVAVAGDEIHEKYSNFSMKKYVINLATVSDENGGCCC